MSIEGCSLAGSECDARVLYTMLPRGNLFQGHGGCGYDFLNISHGLFITSHCLWFRLESEV